VHDKGKAVEHPFFLDASPKTEQRNGDYSSNIDRKGVGDMVVGIIIFIYGMLGFVLAASVYSRVSRMIRKG
jgi:hypothetical protein